MKRYKLTPTPNDQGEVITPEIVSIDAKLVLKQAEQERIAKAIAAKNYVSPQGFSTDTATYDYVIGPHDAIGIHIWPHPSADLSTTAVASSGQGTSSSDANMMRLSVDSSGNIYYPYIGAIHVAGKTLEQAREEVTKILSEYMKRPVITIEVLEYKSRYIEVLGAVGKGSSMLPLEDAPITIRQAVTLSGGLNQCGASGSTTNTSNGQSGVCADAQHVELQRGKQTVIVNFNNLQAPNGDSQNYVLKSGDTINVPMNTKSRVFMLGAVKATGPLNIGSDAMSLREAIGDAGGVMNSSADPTYTYIIRNFNKHPEIFELNAASPDALNLAGDFFLKPQDIVFVSTSKLTDFNAVLGQVTPSFAMYAYTKSLLD